MNPGDLIFGLNHIGLFEPDVEAAADFYRQMFGFETRSVNLDASGKPHIIFLEQRGLVLELLQIDQDPSEWMQAAQATPNHVALCCSDTKKMVALLKAKGVTFETECDKRVTNFGREGFDIDIIFLHGPGGERIEIFQEIHGA